MLKGHLACHVLSIGSCDLSIVSRPFSVAHMIMSCFSPSVHAVLYHVFTCIVTRPSESNIYLCVQLFSMGWVIVSTLMFEPCPVLFPRSVAVCKRNY